MKNLIQKCLDELSKEEPSIDYIRGILESISEMQAVEKIATWNEGVRKTEDKLAAAIVNNAFKTETFPDIEKQLFPHIDDSTFIEGVPTLSVQTVEQVRALSGSNIETA